MLIKLLENNVKQGVLNLRMPDGKTYRFGKDWEFELGETYMNGGWDFAVTGITLSKEQLAIAIMATSDTS